MGGVDGQEFWIHCNHAKGETKEERWKYSGKLAR